MPLTEESTLMFEYIMSSSCYETLVLFTVRKTLAIVPVLLLLPPADLLQFQSAGEPEAEHSHDHRGGSLLPGDLV